MSDKPSLTSHRYTPPPPREPQARRPATIGDSVAPHLADVEAQSAETRQHEERILAGAEARLERVSGDLEAARPKALAGDAEAEAVYQALVVERGQLHLIIARSRQILAAEQAPQTSALNTLWSKPSKPSEEPEAVDPPAPEEPEATPEAEREEAPQAPEEEAPKKRRRP